MNIQLPDGRVVEFPDSMSPQDINSALEKEFGGSGSAQSDWLAPPSAKPPAQQQIEGPMRYLLGAGSYALKGAEGTLGIPGDIQQLVRSGINKLPIPQQYRDLANAATYPESLVMGRDLPTGQEIGDAVNKASPVGPLTDNPRLLPQNRAERFGAAGLEAIGGAGPFGLEALPIALASGEAGQTARELAPNSKVLPLVAGLATASPLGLEASVGGIAKTLGNSRTLQEAGSTLQEAADNWITNLPFRINAAEKPLTAKVPGTASVSLNNYDGALQTLLRQGGRASGSAQMLAPQDTRMLRNLSDEVDLLRPEGGGLGELSFDEARYLRSKLGSAMIKTPGNPLNPEVAKNLYSALSRDIGKTAADNGALPEWEAFNEQTKNLYQKGETFNQYLRNSSGSSITPDQAAAKALPAALTKGSRDLGTIREEMPETADELAAGFLHATPSRWHLLSPEAQSALIEDAGNRATLSHVIPRKSGGNLEKATNDIGAIRAGEIGAAGVGLASRMVLGHDASNVLGGSDLGQLLGQIGYPLVKQFAKRMTSPNALKRAAVGGIVEGPQAADEEQNALVPR